MVVLLLTAVFCWYKFSIAPTKSVINTGVTTSQYPNNIIYRNNLTETEDYFYFNNNAGFAISGVIPKNWQTDYKAQEEDPSLLFIFSITKGEYKIEIDRYSKGMGCIYPDSLKFTKPGNSKFPYEGKVKKLYEVKNIFGSTYRIDEPILQDNRSISGTCSSPNGHPDSFLSSGIHITTPAKQDPKTVIEIKNIIAKLLPIFN